MIVDSVIPSQEAGLQVDAQIGDREASLGSNTEVDADNINDVVGRDEVSNEAQVINQTNVPTSWFIIGVLAFLFMTAIAFIGWMMPVPKWCQQRKE